eukprot:gene2406-2887_t
MAPVSRGTGPAAESRGIRSNSASVSSDDGVTVLVTSVTNEPLKERIGILEQSDPVPSVLMIPAELPRSLSPMARNIKPIGGSNATVDAAPPPPAPLNSTHQDTKSPSDVQEVKTSGPVLPPSRLTRPQPPTVPPSAKFHSTGAPHVPASPAALAAAPTSPLTKPTWSEISAIAASNRHRSPRKYDSSASRPLPPSTLFSSPGMSSAPGLLRSSVGVGEGEGALEGGRVRTRKIAALANPQLVDSWVSVSAIMSKTDILTQTQTQRGSDVDLTLAVEESSSQQHDSQRLDEEAGEGISYTQDALPDPSPNRTSTSNPHTDPWGAVPLSSSAARGERGDGSSEEGLQVTDTAHMYPSSPATHVEPTDTATRDDSSAHRLRPSNPLTSGILRISPMLLCEERMIACRGALARCRGVLSHRGLLREVCALNDGDQLLQPEYLELIAATVPTEEEVAALESSMRKNEEERFAFLVAALEPRLSQRIQCFLFVLRYPVSVADYLHRIERVDRALNHLISSPELALLFEPSAMDLYPAPKISTLKDFKEGNHRSLVNRLNILKLKDDGYLARLYGTLCDTESVQLGAVLVGVDRVGREWLESLSLFTEVAEDIERLRRVLAGTEWEDVTDNESVHSHVSDANGYFADAWCWSGREGGDFDPCLRGSSATAELAEGEASSRRGGGDGAMTLNRAVVEVMNENVNNRFLDRMQRFISSSTVDKERLEEAARNLDSTISRFREYIGITRHHSSSSSHAFVDDSLTLFSTLHLNLKKLVPIASQDRDSTGKVATSPLGHRDKRFLSHSVIQRRSGQVSYGKGILYKSTSNPGIFPVHETGQRSDITREFLEFSGDRELVKSFGNEIQEPPTSMTDYLKREDEKLEVWPQVSVPDILTLRPVNEHVEDLITKESARSAEENVLVANGEIGDIGIQWSVSHGHESVSESRVEEEPVSIGSSTVGKLDYMVGGEDILQIDERPPSTAHERSAVEEPSVAACTPESHDDAPGVGHRNPFPSWTDESVPPSSDVSNERIGIHAAGVVSPKEEEVLAKERGDVLLRYSGDGPDEAVSVNSMVQTGAGLTGLAYSDGHHVSEKPVALGQRFGIPSAEPVSDHGHGSVSHEDEVASDKPVAHGLNETLEADGVPSHGSDQEELPISDMPLSYETVFVIPVIEPVSDHGSVSHEDEVASDKPVAHGLNETLEADGVPSHGSDQEGLSISDEPLSYETVSVIPGVEPVLLHGTISHEKGVASDEPVALGLTETLEADVVPSHGGDLEGLSISDEPLSYETVSVIPGVEPVLDHGSVSYEKGVASDEPVAHGLTETLEADVVPSHGGDLEGLSISDEPLSYETVSVRLAVYPVSDHGSVSHEDEVAGNKSMAHVLTETLEPDVVPSHGGDLEGLSISDAPLSLATVSEIPGVEPVLDHGSVSYEKGVASDEPVAHFSTETLEPDGVPSHGGDKEGLSISDEPSSYETVSVRLAVYPVSDHGSVSHEDEVAGNKSMAHVLTETLEPDVVPSHGGDQEGLSISDEPLSLETVSEIPGVEPVLDHGSVSYEKGVASDEPVAHGLTETLEADVVPSHGGDLEGLSISDEPLSYETVSVRLAVYPVSDHGHGSVSHEDEVAGNKSMAHVLTETLEPDVVPSHGGDKEGLSISDEPLSLETVSVIPGVKPVSDHGSASYEKGVASDEPVAQGLTETLEPDGVPSSSSDQDGLSISDKSLSFETVSVIPGVEPVLLHGTTSHEKEVAGDEPVALGLTEFDGVPSHGGDQEGLSISDEPLSYETISVIPGVEPVSDHRSSSLQKAPIVDEPAADQLTRTQQPSANGLERLAGSDKLLLLPAVPVIRAEEPLLGRESLSPKEESDVGDPLMYGLAQTIPIGGA